ncbi:MAG: leucine-rich repeat protein, partial [Muribaculaceae bacterium]|nr:leucine-rich repeat protein [Muribaculaceae bacterium]
MKKLLLLAALTGIGFSASAAVGDLITDGTFYFNVVAEGDVNEVEFAPKPSGTYTVNDRTIFGNYNTVTIGGVTYNVVGIGEGAFRNAQFPTQNITNLPSSLRYISDYAFQGVKSGKSDTDSNIRFYATIETVSPLAFIDNEINGTINVSGTSERFKQVACTASRIQYNSNNCYAPCKNGNTLVAIGGKGKVLGDGGGGYANANKLTLASDFTIVGAHAFHGNQGYTQLDLGSVVEIQEYAFKNSAVQQLTLPATLTTVDPTAFEGATAIFSITCNATTPPAGCVFEDAVYAAILANGHITVPAEALEAYKADVNWGKFWAAPAPTTYTITVADGIENGTVEVDKAEAEEGETVTVTATPIDRSYQLKSITVTPETLNLVVEV